VDRGGPGVVGIEWTCMGAFVALIILVIGALQFAKNLEA
jgi:hypothetical protein